MFLGPLPTAINQGIFPKVSMQVSCVGRGPEERAGLVLPGAVLFNFEIVNAAVLDQQFENLWGALQQSLRAGKSVLTHCVAR